MPVLNTTDKNFKNDVLDSSKPVLVDFWAEWCGPCKAIAPALDEISNEMSNNITVAKINYPQKFSPDLSKFLNSTYDEVEFRVDKIQLLETKTLSEGVVHKTLNTFSFLEKQIKKEF